ncbi:SDR family oxidoreductase [Roseibacterium sp. SDUM158017]|uniref:D-erythronate dehydrogenase n=1 Tax=Roseicyclus salinarum TaxID=3036773 RepID=UPI00241559D5|nr:D-erythronate dehydrogenase [Roseibacterium sp. SDUM158017]MDG4649754.1 SDR family oxidoreductase [Roseibacterium sp. SDUM158017]
MRVLIIGAGGMIGAKLALRLMRERRLAGRDIAALELADLAAPTPPEGEVPVTARSVDITADGAAEDLVSGRPDVIFHLAAMVSGAAERDFEGGYRVNVDATRALLEAIRRAHEADGYTPRLVFASSLAVYGAPLPDPVPDDQIRAPRSSYGTQKAIVELLLDDYTRRGFLDAIGLRLPTIVIRPGAPNAAASGFFSGILREPLAGLPSRLPVSREVKHWLASPRAAAGFLVHAAGLDGAAVGPRRTITMPGVETTVGGQIEALARAAGPKAAALIEEAPDPAIAAIIETWPRAFAPARAAALGFVAEASVDDLIAVYLEDDAPGGAGA